MTDWQTYHQSQRIGDEMQGGNWGPVLGFVAFAIAVTVYGVLWLLS